MLLLVVTVFLFYIDGVFSPRAPSSMVPSSICTFYVCRVQAVAFVSSSCCQCLPVFVRVRFAGCGGWLGQIHSREDVGEEQVALAVACKRPISLTEPTVGQEPALWTGKLEGRARYARQGSPIPAYPLPECWSKQWGRPSAKAKIMRLRGTSQEQ